MYYVYEADLLCASCGERARDEVLREWYRNPASIPAYIGNVGDFDMTDETTYDSDDFPKGPFTDDDLDLPYNNCGNCHAKLMSQQEIDEARERSWYV